MEFSNRYHTDALNIYTDIGVCIRFIILNIVQGRGTVSTDLNCPSVPFTILKGVATATLTSRNETPLVVGKDRYFSPKSLCVKHIFLHKTMQI